MDTPEPSAYQDQQLVCKECHREFVFNATEQQEYASQGRRHPPGRCPTCLSARKARLRREEPERDDQRRTFAVTCTKCGLPAEVPFRPRPGRPVLCRECYLSERR